MHRPRPAASRSCACLLALFLGLIGPGVFGTGHRLCAQTPSEQHESEGEVPDSSKADGKGLSRADRWRRQRRHKARDLTPPEPGFFDRVRHFVAQTGGSVVPHRFILDIPHLEVAGFHPVLGGLGIGGGVLYEPSFSHREDRFASLELLGSLDREYSSEALLGLESAQYVGYGYARFQHQPGEAFFGIGPESRESAESVFRLNEGIFGALVGRSLGDRTLLGGHLSYQVNRFGRGRGDAPSVGDQFGDVPGVGTDLDYLMVGTFFEFDSRDTPYRRAFGHRFAPTERRLRSVSLEAARGFYLATEITHNVDTRHHEFDFTRFTLDMREFVPVDEELMHGFSFRQFASFTRSSDGRMPFYRMQSIGGARSLRGYAEDRFRDRNVLLLNAEVRCQVWHWIDMALFTDAGHVFRNFGGVDWGDPRLGYGVGFRIRKDGQTLARVDVARSDEGVRAHLDLGSLF